MCADPLQLLVVLCLGLAGGLLVGLSVGLGLRPRRDQRRMQHLAQLGERQAGHRRARRETGATRIEGPRVTKFLARLLCAVGAHGWRRHTWARRAEICRRCRAVRGLW